MQVGFACVDCHAAGLFLSQSVEQAAYPNTLTLLTAHAPEVVVVCSSAASSGLTQLISMYERGGGSACRVVALPRCHFDDVRGSSLVRLVASDETQKQLASDKGLYLALAAANACLHFCADELQLLVRVCWSSTAPSASHCLVSAQLTHRIGCRRSRTRFACCTSFLRGMCTWTPLLCRTWSSSSCSTHALAAVRRSSAHCTAC